MKFLLTILAAAVISYSIAVPVSQHPEPEPTTLDALSTFKDALSSELRQWKTLLKNKGASNIFFKDILLPRIKECFEIMDRRLELSYLSSIKDLLEDQVMDPEDIVYSYCSCDDETIREEALIQFDYYNLLQEFHIKHDFHLFYHYPESYEKNPMDYMKRALLKLKEKRRSEIFSKLYETKKTAKEIMSQSFENIINNLFSFDLLQHFSQIYSPYARVCGDRRSPVFRVEREFGAKVEGHSDAISEPSSNTQNDADEPGSSSKHPGLVNNKLDNIIDDSSNLISESNSNSEPSSNLQRIKFNFPNIFENDYLYRVQRMLLFPTLVVNPTLEISPKLENWRQFVSAIHPIEESELIPALDVCIKIMKSLETFIPYRSYFDEYENEHHELALKTADGFHDLLKDAALLVQPWEYFPKSRILPVQFFENRIFIEFCTTYSHLVLQNNCYRLQMKPVKPKYFVSPNRSFVKLIQDYQPLLELPSFDQIAKERNDGALEGEGETLEEKHGILQGLDVFLQKQDGFLMDYKMRALMILKKNLKNFLQGGPIRSVLALEEFFEANKKHVGVINLARSRSIWAHHVPKLLCDSPYSLHRFSCGRIQIDYGYFGESLESRRLYTPLSPSVTDLGHNHQCSFSNCRRRRGLV